MYSKYIGKYSEEDIFNSNGILLLSKGEKLTLLKINRLRKLSAEKFNKPNLPVINKNTSLEVSDSTERIKSKFNIYDYNSLKISTDILNTILFDSKDSLWYIYIKSLSNYIDWIYTHSLDVSQISMIVAKNLGIDSDELYNIGLGAFLHDVGKLLIPKRIINKKGKLENYERLSIKQHPELGISILQDCELPKQCTDIILQHHERIDGSGYPYGLNDSEISHGSKIVMVCDILDANTSYSSYKSPGSMKKVGMEIKSMESGFSKEVMSSIDHFMG